MICERQTFGKLSVVFDVFSTKKWVTVCSLALPLPLALPLTLALDINLNLDLDLELALILDLDLDLNVALSSPRITAHDRPSTTDIPLRRSSPTF